MISNNKIYLIIISFFSLLIIINSCTKSPTKSEPEKIEFGQSDLEFVIREILDKPDDELTIEDLESIETIFVNSNTYDLSDLKGIEYCTNLIHLSISVSDIEDISYVSNLIKLEILDLAANNVRDITPLSNLVNLSSLVLRHNPINYLSELTNLTNL